MENESHPPIDGMKKLLSVAAHASYLFGFTYLLLPLVLYVYFNGKDDFVAKHAKQAGLAQLIAGVLVVIAFILTFVLIGVLVWPVVGVIIAILIGCSAYACYKAANGEEYSYPFLSGGISKKQVGTLAAFVVVAGICGVLFTANLFSSNDKKTAQNESKPTVETQENKRLEKEKNAAIEAQKKAEEEKRLAEEKLRQAEEKERQQEEEQRRLREQEEQQRQQQQQKPNIPIQCSNYTYDAWNEYGNDITLRFKFVIENTSSSKIYLLDTNFIRYVTCHIRHVYQ